MSGAVGLDWYRFSFPVSYLEPVKRFLSEFVGEFVRESPGRYGYANGLRLAENESSVMWSAVGVGVSRDDACVDLNGAAVGALDAHAGYEMVRGLRQYAIKGTRIDCRFDDYDWIVGPDAVRQAGEDGNVSPFRVCEVHGEGEVGEGKKRIAAGFGRKGSKGSGVYLIVYDKNNESGGAINAVRWEARYYNDRAQQLGFLLGECETVEKFAAAIGGAVGGCVDFRDRLVDPKYFGRCPQLPWWVELVKRMGCSPVKCEPKHSEFQQRLEWSYAAAHLVAATRKAFQAKNDFLGWDQWLAKWIEKGLEKLLDRHEDFGRWAAGASPGEVPF